MFEFYQNTLCVQGGWLFREAGVMSESNYKKLNVRYFRTMRRGCRNNPSLIDFESIPDRFRKKIIEKFGDPYKNAKHYTFIDLLEFDQQASDYYNTFTLITGDGLPEKRKKEYLANAIILNAIAKLHNDDVARRKALGGSKSNLWTSLVEAVHNLPQHTYPHTLPKNVRRLKEKLREYQKGGYNSLVHKGYCNKNSEKINENAKLWLISRWANQVNRAATIAQLHQEYNECAAIEGWKLLKEKDTIYNFLNQENVKSMWYGHRYGELKWKEKYTYHHSTKMPTMRDSLWYSDGTKLNYFYQDKDGKTRTCQVYEVMDAFSEVFLGYHISSSENYESQYFAYKMAIQTSGYRPYQISYDNQGGHKKLTTGDFLTRLARLSIKTQPYNGKSKSIESAFGRFQQQFLKQDWFFTGMNIGTKKLDSKANREFVNTNKNSLPTLKDIKEIYKIRRQEWNEAPHPHTGIPRIEMYRASSNPKCPAINTWDLVSLFWIERKQPVMVTPYGITFKENKEKFTYMVYDKDRMPDLKFLKNNVDRKVWIKYDPSDKTMIYVYKKDPAGLKFIAAAELKIEIHRGKQEQLPGEAEWITRTNELNKQHRVDSFKETQEILEQFGATAEQQGLQSPKISGVKSTYNKDKKVNSDIGEVLKEESNLVPDIDKTSQDFYDKY